MSNFPFNNDGYKYIQEVNGSPLKFSEARALADKVLYWHTNSDTADFTQSGDGFDSDTILLAFGLVELLSDPNAIKRLITTGKEVKSQVEMILNSEKILLWDEKIKPMLNEFLDTEEDD